MKALPFIDGLVTYNFPLAQPTLNNNFSMQQDIKKVVKYVAGDRESLSFYQDILSWPTTLEAAND
ncbi:hypothetical protein PR048_004127 [Dryococelus australis]|uniref:Uncharacterized protein n=1 Tax=Dryococelus australis TaxID=614101 RepID=A0ABQ9I4N2_9NEOP|nr:hypothetical protein PR048_004127 [Dryococelus australis]